MSKRGEKKYFNKKQHVLDYFDNFYVKRGVGNKERNIFEKRGFLVCSQAKPRPPLNRHFFKVKILGKNLTKKRGEDLNEESNGSCFMRNGAILTEIVHFVFLKFL